MKIIYFIKDFLHLLKKKVVVFIETFTARFRKNYIDDDDDCNTAAIPLMTLESILDSRIIYA